MSCNDQKYTITFDERVKGWTSFHSFFPDFMVGINNQFFTFKNGNLFIHHSDQIDRNVYYGVQYPSKISMIFNDSPSDVKELKSVSLEGNSAWNSVLKGYITGVDDYRQSTIKESEYVKKEGFWYAYARRDENSQQTDSKSSYGIGRVTAIVGNTVTVNGYNDVITVGDNIREGIQFAPIGNILSVNRNGNITEMELDSVATLNIGDFVIGTKNARIEGANLRGYSLRFDLDQYSPIKTELFAVNAEVSKSHR